MFRFLEIKDLTDRKKLLVAQSDLHRRTLLVQLDDFHNTVEDFKKRFLVVGGSSVALGLGALLSRMFSRKAAPSPASGGGGGGFFAKIASGISMFQQVKSIFNRFAPHSHDPSHDGPPI
jgi:hypothetical protein